MHSKNKKGIGLLGPGVDKKLKEATEKLKIKYRFDDLHRLFVLENDLDFVIVTGHATAEGGKEQGIPKGLDLETLRGGNFSDLQFLPVMISHFAAWRCKTYGFCLDAKRLSIKMVPDIYVELSDVENHNLVLFGAGNVNCVTEYIFKLYWGNSEILPVHFMKVDTHDIIVSDITGRNYSHEPMKVITEDYGILEMVPNPWNDDKVIVICAGIDFWGTQAATLKLFEKELGNNEKDPRYPARVLYTRLNTNTIEWFKRNRAIYDYKTIDKDSITFKE